MYTHERHMHGSSLGLDATDLLFFIFVVRECVDGYVCTAMYSSVFLLLLGRCVCECSVCV